MSAVVGVNGKTRSPPVKRLHWYIARHYLGSSRGGLLSLITWIDLGGVTVGVTALVVVIAVMTGMQ